MLDTCMFIIFVLYFSDIYVESSWIMVDSEWFFSNFKGNIFLREKVL